MLIAIFVVVGLMVFGPTLLRWWLGALQAKGIDVSKAECEYNPERYRYEAVIVVYNTERVYKTIMANVRTRFWPPLGKRWPDRSSRMMYRVNSKPLTIVFEPDGNIEEKFLYTLPDELADYGCTTKFIVNGQLRHKARPSIGEVEAAPEQIRDGFTYRIRQFLSDRF